MEDYVITAFTHTRVHTHKHGPTRSRLADSRELPDRQDLEEGPRMRNVPPPGPYPPWKGSGNTANTAGPQDQGQAQPRAGRKQDAVQEAWESPAETAQAQAMGKVQGQLVCCPEQNCVFTAQPLRAWDWRVPCGQLAWISLGTPSGKVCNECLGSGLDFQAVQARSLHRA